MLAVIADNARLFADAHIEELVGVVKAGDDLVFSVEGKRLAFTVVLVLFINLR